MTWGMLILLLMRYLGPPLAKVIREWLERRLMEAAERLPPLDTTKPLEQSIAKLFVATRSREVGPFRRRLLAFAYRVSVDRVDRTTNTLHLSDLTREEKAEFDHILVGSNDHPEETVSVGEGEVSRG